MTTKRWVPAVGALMAMGMLTSTVAQAGSVDTPWVDGREADPERRIDAGVARDQLTGSEGIASTSSSTGSRRARFASKRTPS
jgi:hypothetical protein